jgi:peptide/nickel transport system permease protein
VSAAADAAVGAEAVGGSGQVWARLRADRGSLFALVFLASLCAVALLADWIAPADPNQIDVYGAFASPSAAHLLGTDDLGRDVLSRLIFGARVSLRASLQVVLGALLLGVPIGLVSGYFGGRIDNLLMRSMDALMSLPPLILALAIAGVLGPGLTNTMIAISIVMVPSFARLIRGQTLAVREEGFVEASISIGSPTGWILRRRILPNVASPLLVQTSIALGTALIVEASLSYLGLGIQPPQPSWGGMLRRAYDDVFAGGWLLFVPGAAIAATVLAFNALGEGLRDALALGAGVGAAGRWGRLGLTTSGARSAKGSLEKSVERPSERAVEQREIVLDVRGLCVEFETAGGPQRVVEDVSFSIRRGQTLGLVGESGSGKTVTALSIMRLIPSPPGRVVAGSVRLGGTELLDLPLAQMRALRGNRVAMVFQDAMTSLNPALTIGYQLVEAVRLHRDMRRADAGQRALELLQRVQIADPLRRMRDYPHQLSGGMRQRVMIAMALAGEPDLLIADEPTTALDVTVQAQILDLLRELQDELGLAMLFVTHDLGVIAQICDEVSVLYAGQIVEHCDVATLFHHPSHPYTEGLLAAMPSLENSDESLYGIPGNIPSPRRMPSGCRFHPRCPYVEDSCRTREPSPIELETGQQTRCLRHSEIELKGIS